MIYVNNKYLLIVIGIFKILKFNCKLREILLGTYFNKVFIFLFFYIKIKDIIRLFNKI